MLENLLVDVVGKVLSNKMSKSDPEYKVFRESYDQVLQYLQERFKYIADDLIYDIFFELSDKQDELVNVLSRNMLDFCDLMRFYGQALRQVNPMVNIGQSTEE